MSAKQLLIDNLRRHQKATHNLIGVLLNELANATTTSPDEHYGRNRLFEGLKCGGCEGEGRNKGKACPDCDGHGFIVPTECVCQTSAGESRGYCIICRGKQAHHESKEWS